MRDELQDAPGPATTLSAELSWKGAFVFDAQGASAAAIRVDGDGGAGLSPMETLLAALGSCAGTDVVDILRKGRQETRSLTIRLTGERSSSIPRRFTRIRAEVVLAGRVERPKAERAVRLAFDNYCSVRASLDPSIAIEIELRLDP